MRKIIRQAGILLIVFQSISLAQFAGEIPLGTANVTFIGEVAGDQAGYHLSIVGDVNNDGIDDMLIAAPQHEPPTRKGNVYLIFGHSGEWEKTVNLANADVTFTGEQVDNKAGHDVFGLGDVNNDGIDDLAIGVKFYKKDGLATFGKVYIFLGKEGAWNKEISLAESDASFVGEKQRTETAHVYPAGDLNGDSYDDFIIGAGFYDINDNVSDNTGKVYVIFGKSTESWQNNVTLDQADASFLGENENDLAGHRVAGAGDVNDDGFDDFIVGANWVDFNGKPDVGKIYLILGKADGWERNTSFSEADASFIGDENKWKYEAGFNVCGPGDVNNDGFDDILIGSQKYSQVFLLLGNQVAWGPNTMLATSADAIFSGESGSDNAGGDIRTAGDINGDGYSDFIIGAYGHDTDENNIDAGRAYLIYGNGTDHWTRDMSLANADALFSGENTNDQAGFSVAGGGDVNGDGIDDLLIGANLNDSNGEDAGKAYLLFGGRLEFAVTVPNGGEKWEIGTRQIVRWYSPDPGGDVLIYFSRDGGNTWEFLTRTVDDGAAYWDIAGTPSDSCLIRIDHENSGSSDVSNAFFEIGNPSLTISFPNGDDSLYSGKTYRITWESLGTIGSVHLEYSINNGVDWSTIENNAANSGAYDWLVPTTPSANCLVRISDAADGDPVDVSDNPFSILNSPEFTLLSPNGGEQWFIDSEQMITWISKYNSSNLKIQLSRDNGASWSMINKSTPDDSLYEWKVTGPASDQCVIKISDVKGLAFDTGDAVFSIVEKPYVQVVSPNGGENWPIASQQKIRWISTNTTGQVNIEISRDEGLTWDALQEALTDSGTFSWTVTGPSAKNCLIRVSNPATSVADTSDAVFEISDQRELTVKSPNGGENWIVESTHDITWHSVNIGDSVRIELSRDAGSTWELIAATTKNDSVHSWQVTGPASSACIVRISDLAGSVVDQSDSTFTISDKPAITVISPNGDEIWQIGSSHNITWTSVNTSDQVNVHLSRDAGSTWEIIGENIEDTGQYDWTVTGELSEQCLVRVTDVNGAPFDVSDAVFQIADKPTVAVTSPRGGEHWIIGTGYEIKWNSINISDLVRIELSRDSGSTWETLQDTTANDGVWNWTATAPASNGCLVKVSDIAGAVSDRSDSAFSIMEAPHIRVVSPNGGEAWQLDTQQSILWTSVNTSGSVNIQLSRDQGQSWETLAENIADSGQYNWDVSGSASEMCLVRVSDADGDPADESDAQFTIEEKPGITVLTPQGGEVLDVGSTTEITWTWVKVGDLIRAELSRDNGATWTTLKDSLQNSGQWTWTVTEPISNLCIVRISDIGGTVTATNDGVFMIKYPTGVAGRDDLVPKDYDLAQNYPNPFNPSTHIAYQLPKQNHVVIRIYNTTGTLIKILVDDVKNAGAHSATWDGRDDFGRNVSSGLYFYRMDSGDFSKTQRMLLLK